MDSHFAGSGEPDEGDTEATALSKYLGWLHPFVSQKTHDENTARWQKEALKHGGKRNGAWRKRTGARVERIPICFDERVAYLLREHVKPYQCSYYVNTLVEYALEKFIEKRKREPKADPFYRLIAW